MKQNKTAYVLAGLAMSLALPLAAQEAVTTVPVETPMDWKDLVRQIETLEQGYSRMQGNVNAINRCGARGMFYVPGYAADPQNCKPA